PYRPRGKINAIEAFKAGGMEAIYMMYFQEPGVAERELERDVRRTLASVYYSLSGSLPADKRWHPFVPPGKGLLDTGFEPTLPLSWLSEADLAEYARDFTASGFRGGLNWYRNLHRSWELMAPFAAAPNRQPSLFIAGERDPVIAMPGMRTALEELRPVLPGLTKSVIIEGAGHWVQQEAPDQVNALLLDFLRAL